MQTHKLTNIENKLVVTSGKGGRGEGQYKGGRMGGANYWV